MSESIVRASESIVLPSKSQSETCKSLRVPTKSLARPSESIGICRVQVTRIIESRDGACGPQHMASDTPRAAGVSINGTNASIGVARVAQREAWLSRGARR